MEELKNKWNGRTYFLIKAEGNDVTLQRDDGSQFTIQQSDFKFNYEKKKSLKNN